VTRWSRVSVLTISERRAALGNDTPVPKQMNGAVSRTRLGINRWLALAPFGVLFCPGLGYYCADGEARKTAVFLGLDFQREFESSSLQRRVRSEPRSGRSHLGPGQAVDLVDDHDVDREGLGQPLIEVGCPTMQRSAVCRLELADGAPTRLSMPFEAKRRNKPTSNRPNAPGGG
jgi:hypothetical protein